MKNLTKSLFVIILFSIVFISSCKKDDTSTNQVTSDPRDAICGNYIVSDSSFMSGVFSSVYTYVLIVSKENTPKDTIYLKNWRNSGKNYYAVGSGNFYSIPPQLYVNPYNISGSASFKNNTIHYNAHFDIFDYIGNGTKQ